MIQSCRYCSSRSLPPGGGDLIIAAVAAIEGRIVDREQLVFLQPAQHRIQGGFGHGEVRLNVLGDLIAVGIRLRQDRQNHGIQQRCTN